MVSMDLFPIELLIALVGGLMCYLNMRMLFLLVIAIGSAKSIWFSYHLLRLIHVCLVILCMLGPFSDNLYVVSFCAASLPAIAIHWQFNQGRCCLTQIEQHMAKRANVDQVEYELGIVERVVSNIHHLTAIVVVLTLVSWIKIVRIWL